MEDFLVKVVEVLDRVVKDYSSVESILLSGGVDTSVLACMFRRYFNFHALVVGFGKDFPDLKYAKLVAKKLGLPFHVKIFNVKEALKAAEQVVKILKTFDPVEVRNDIPIYVGMKHLKKLSFNSVVTGDGGDELFAGYTFLFKFKPSKIDNWIKNIVKHWFFASKILGESLGLKVYQPFMDKRMVKLALKIPAKYKVVEKDGIIYGKWILREAFKNFLPSEVVWRPKNPIEMGSGSIRLADVFHVDQKEFSDLSKIVRLKSMEQAYYLKLYLKNVGEIPKPKIGEKQCPNCGAGIRKNSNFCRICGTYLV